MKKMIAFDNINKTIEDLIARASLMEAIEIIISSVRTYDLSHLEEAIILSMEINELNKRELGGVIEKKEELLLKRLIALRILKLKEEVFTKAFYNSY